MGGYVIDIDIHTRGTSSARTAATTAERAGIAVTERASVLTDMTRPVMSYGWAPLGNGAMNRRITGERAVDIVQTRWISS